VKNNAVAWFACAWLLTGQCFGTENKGASNGTSAPNRTATHSESVELARSHEEIQAAFWRQRTRLFDIYRKYLKKNPNLKGKMMLRLMIERNGTVSTCEVESTNIQSHALVEDVVQAVKQFYFGDKPSARRTQIAYPIEFRPAP
jgi:hypothetical protein